MPQGPRARSLCQPFRSLQGRSHWATSPSARTSRCGTYVHRVCAVPAAPSPPLPRLSRSPVRCGSSQLSTPAALTKNRPSAHSEFREEPVKRSELGWFTRNVLVRALALETHTQQSPPCLESGSSACTTPPSARSLPVPYACMHAWAPHVHGTTSTPRTVRHKAHRLYSSYKRPTSDSRSVTAFPCRRRPSGTPRC
jgi:hypothetical protein